VTNVLPPSAGFLDEPGMFSSLEIWEQFLAEVKAMPDSAQKPQTVRRARCLHSPGGVHAFLHVQHVAVGCSSSSISFGDHSGYNDKGNPKSHFNYHSTSLKYELEKWTAKCIINW
jgi:hypothetical protein